MTIDYDNDGRLDILVTRNNAAVNLFRNEWQQAGNWIGFDLQGPDGNLDAIGARVTVEVAGHRIVEEKKAGSSLQTSGDPRLHFGLGDADSASRVSVRWPSGDTTTFENLPGGRYYRLVQGVNDPVAVPTP